MTTLSRMMTADELLHLRDPGWRHELVRGELRRQPYAGEQESIASTNLSAHLWWYVREHNLGRCAGANAGFQIAANPDTVRTVSAAFTRHSRIEWSGRLQGYPPLAPDFVGLAVSAADPYQDVVEKVYGWLMAGTQMLVLVEVATETLLVHRSFTRLERLTVEDTLDGAEVVPGWQMSVREMFA